MTDRIVITMSVKLLDGQEFIVDIPLSPEEFQTWDAAKMCKTNLEPAYAYLAMKSEAAWIELPSLERVEQLIESLA